MKRFLFCLPVLMLVAIPAALRAAEFNSDACRFILPEGFEIHNTDDGSLFLTTNGRDSASFFFLRSEQEIDKRKCLALSDAKWFSSLEPYTVVETEKPWFARYDKYTVYRKPNGSYVKVYRYVSTRQVGFLVAKNTSGDWTAADEIASGCRGFRSLWEQVRRVWYWFVGAIAVIGAAFYLHERFLSRKFWKRAALWTLASGAIYGLGALFLAQYLSYVYLLIGVGYLFALMQDGDDDSSDDDSPSGCDGTGKTFDADI